MEDRIFDQLVERALKDLPEEFKQKLSNLSVISQDLPNREQLQKLGGSGFLLGLYEGIPQTKRRNYGIGGPLPDKITIFKIPLIRVSRSYSDLVKNIRQTVMHEIGHHFGLSEEELRKIKK